MQIALLGGTGDIGEGLALRIARDTDNDVLVGSREAEKAAAKAEEYTDKLPDTTVEGLENPAAAARADIAVAAVPAYHLSDTIGAVADELADTISP